jgi:hypothetical protein
MEQQLARHPHDLESIAQRYLAALRDRDVGECGELYADDAVISTMYGPIRGRAEIEKWHKDRFDADLEIIRVNQIRVNESSVTIDAVVTTKRLRFWRIENVRGTATLKIDSGKICEVVFAMKMYNPLENW